MILAIVDDLIFGSKISATARANNIPVVLSPSLHSVSEQQFDLVIIDLNLRQGNVLDLIRMAKTKFAGAKTIGYLSHVQTELKSAALEAGCDKVMARSEFSANLDKILKQT